MDLFSWKLWFMLLHTLKWPVALPCLQHKGALVNLTVIPKCPALWADFMLSMFTYPTFQPKGIAHGLLPQLLPTPCLCSGCFLAECFDSQGHVLMFSFKLLLLPGCPAQRSSFDSPSTTWSGFISPLSVWAPWGTVLQEALQVNERLTDRALPSRWPQFLTIAVSSLRSSKR